MDGDLLNNIKKCIKEDKIDFVIMGTAGAGMGYFFYGYQYSSVISGIDVPMFCIPIEAKFKKIEVIGFTTRFRTKDKKALKWFSICKKYWCYCEMFVSKTAANQMLQK
jgi:hypothetical protein